MKKWDVTIEDDAGVVWEGTVVREKLEINDYVTIRLHTKQPREAWGYVIMFQEASIT